MQKNVLLKSSLIAVLTLSLMLIPALEAEALTEEEDTSFYAELLYTDFDDVDDEIGFLVGGEFDVRERFDVAGEYMRVSDVGGYDVRVHGLRIKGLLDISDEVAPNREKLSLNLQGGIGYYEAENGDSESDIGFTFGTGLRYEVDEDVEFRGNLGYRILEIGDDDADGIEVSAGLGLTF